MSNAVTVVQVTVEGTDFADLSGIAIDEIVRGGPDEPPQVRGRDDVVPGAMGRFARNRIRDVRTIEMAGWLMGVGTTTADQVTDYWDNRIALGAAMDPTLTLTVVAILRNGDTYNIEARPLPPAVTYTQTAPSTARITLLFESVAPDWTSGGGS